MNGRYRVRGTLIATVDSRCYLHGLELFDVPHDRVAVDRVVRARDSAAAAALAAWEATQPGRYATWRWVEGPAVARVESEVLV